MEPNPSNDSSSLANTAISSSEVINVASMSCDECRVQHRKCDKLKPTCHACKVRGIECCYSAIPKRKQKTEISNKVKSLTSEDLRIVEFYYSDTFFQAVSREELENFISLSYGLDGQYSNLEMKEKAALLHSIRAICECQMGMIEKSEISAKKAKQYLSAVFDHHSSFIVAYVYVHLCSFELWFGRLESGKFYFQTLMVLKEILFGDDYENIFGDCGGKLDKFKTNLKGSIWYLEIMGFNNQDGKNLHEITLETFLTQIPKLFVPEKSEFPEGWDLYLNQPHLIDASNCLDVLSMLEVILSQARLFDQATYGPSFG